MLNIFQNIKFLKNVKYFKKFNIFRKSNYIIIKCFGNHETSIKIFFHISHCF